MSLAAATSTSSRVIVSRLYGVGAGVAAPATAGSARGAEGADVGPEVGNVEAWRMAEREKAAPAVRILHCDEAIAL